MSRVVISKEELEAANAKLLKARELVAEATRIVEGLPVWIQIVWSNTDWPVEEGYNAANDSRRN